MSSRRGLALRDLLATVIALVALASLVVPAISQVRMDSSRQACIGNYRFIAQASGSYSNDYAGSMWALSWKRGTRLTSQFGSTYAGSDLEAQAFQATITLMRLASLGTNPSYYTAPANWIPSIYYTHLALADYVNLPLPASYLICPEDWTRQRYLDKDFSKVPSGDSDTESSWRVPFRSSYSTGTYHWGPSRQTLAPAANGSMQKTPMWYPSGSSSVCDGSIYIDDVNRPHLESEVRFPANKVFLSDDYARHNGKPRYYAYQTAGQDLLFYDGSVRYYRTDSTNPGWNPSSATNRGNMKLRFSFTKQADFWGGLDNNATQASFQAGWYRWTRGGLFGWDVPRMSSMAGKLPNPAVVESELNTSATTGAW